MITEILGGFQGSSRDKIFQGSKLVRGSRLTVSLWDRGPVWEKKKQTAAKSNNAPPLGTKDDDPKVELFTAPFLGPFCSRKFIGSILGEFGVDRFMVEVF